MDLIFAGTPDFAAQHLQILLGGPHRVIAVVTQPDKPGKRGKQLVPSPVKRLALDHGLPVLQPRRLKVDDIAPWPADLLVVVAYGQILRAPVLSAPRLGCINVHASLLPRWRGAAPIQRAILAGDTETGVCIMQMDEGLDTGDVMATRRVTIAPDDSAGRLADKLAAAGADALLTTLDAIEKGTAHRTPQPETGVTWADKISKDEARLDWTRPATELARAVCAFDPDPGAYGILQGLRVKIWRARVGETVPASPGEIVASTPSGIQVACGNGSLVLERIQVPIGKGNVVSAADLINARRREFDVGNRFD